MGKQFVRLSTWLVKQSGAAFALEMATGRLGQGGTETVWFPKSQCEITHPEGYADPERMQVDIPLWLALKKTGSRYDLGRLDGYMGIVTK